MRTVTLIATIFSAAMGVGTAFAPTGTFVSRGDSVRLSMSEDPTHARIQGLVDEHPVLLFMKGSKIFPQCGFSNSAVQILNSYGIEFHTVGTYHCICCSTMQCWMQQSFGKFEVH